MGRASPSKSNGVSTSNSRRVSRKRKRPDDGEEDSDWEMSSEPPLRKRKVLSSSPDSSSESSMPLKVRSSKLNAKQRTIMEDESSDESDEPLLARKQSKDVVKKKKKRTVVESEDDDIESDFDENWKVSKKRTLRKKNSVSYKEQSHEAGDDESEYQMSEDLEIDEFDDEDDGDSEYHP